MFEAQELIFEKKLSRIDLLNYKYKSENVKRIAVYRNHSFELTENTIPLYLDYAGIKAEFIYSDYDDSMSFTNIDLGSDMVILWIDLSRYNINDTEKFVRERVNYLSKIYKKRILFIPSGGNCIINEKNIITYDLSVIEKKLGTKFFDERMEKFSGTKLSAKSMIEISRELGLKYIPACLMTPMKAVIVDLDNTIYKGVLGEDGIDGLELSEAHKLLQKKLAELSEQGFFICISSKNNEVDVEELFNKRNDFPLNKKNITKMCVSWEPKYKAVEKLKTYLNINEKDMLFIDDNVGELISVKERYPNINTILAKDDADITLKVLSDYPRMTKFNINYEDLIRKQDIQSNEERKKLQNTLSGEEFLKTLCVELTYYINPKTQVKRFSELANKTNQFICAYKRYTEKETEDLMQREDSLIITVSMKDKLSDSGIIGGLVFRDNKEYIDIEEIFVSCRALGRGLDKNIVLYPLKLAEEYFGKNKIKMNFVKGERNVPAEKFADKYLSECKNRIAEISSAEESNFITIKVER